MGAAGFFREKGGRAACLQKRWLAVCVRKGPGGEAAAERRGACAVVCGERGAGARTRARGGGFREKGGVQRLGERRDWECAEGPGKEGGGDKEAKCVP